MKMKKWITSVCLVLILVSPLTVFASESVHFAGANQKQEEELVIEPLTAEQAETLYKQLYGEKNKYLRSNLGTCDIGLSNSNGKLLVVYSTSCRGTASKIGVRNFTLQQKSGLLWSNITVKNEYSENTDAFFGGFYITNPVVGRGYRANCTHYAVVGGSEVSMYTETETYKFQ